jgi:hypothetical protein
MEYFILLPDDQPTAIQYDCNKLGETNHVGQFWAYDGFRVLNNIVSTKPELLENIKIFDGKNKHYTINEFLQLLKQYKLVI